MKIKKFEQSGVIITSEKGKSLAIDIGNKTPASKLEGINVNYFLVSHIHGDHFHPENIKVLNPQIIFLPTECKLNFTEFEIKTIEVNKEIEIEDFKIVPFYVDHGPNASGYIENFGFLIYCDSEVLYFAGDIYNSINLDVSQLEVNYLLVPVGGYYTFGPNEAYSFSKQFKKLGKVLPIHYERNEHIDPETYNQFLKICNEEFEILAD
jgi:L-ascorbate metabolism protein UlaG (beta-lactamase superfamily)